MNPNLIICPSCRFAFALNKSSSAEQIPSYCVFCGSLLQTEKTITAVSGHDVSMPPTTASVTLVPGHVPKQESIQFTIGPYQILNTIGKGGMGEVFLAYDTTCGRRIALKRIREDLKEHVQIHNRFLKEARVTSQLTHPAIIPIYAIHGEDQLVYYTMPYVEGETLKQILRKTRSLEKKGEKPDQIGGSIPALIRIFLSICQAVAYAHSKGVLHRDLKPENIIVGKYGEVMILDWGLAKLIRGAPQEEDLGIEKEEKHPLHALTYIGKVVGTVAYMAPERALGQPASIQTDIYSLGVILYQILTLRYPFNRKTLKEFRQNMAYEVLYDPAEVAPYRDVPRILGQMAIKCLFIDPSQRYTSVDELIFDIESYIEGRSEWFPTAELNIDNKTDWEFQENVLIAEHVAITRGPEVSDWVSLMISKESFTQNTKLEAEVRLGETSSGLGFLFSIPEAAERVHLNDGYMLWLGSDLHHSTKLLRSTVEVLHASDVFLRRNELYRVRIEKINNHIYFYLNDVLQFTYLGHIPIIGTHIGLLSRDADFTISPIRISVGSQNIMVNCLAVPDAFLAHKDYATALSEYRRIGYSFPGRAEGREAKFRAGITILEQARNTTLPAHSEILYEQALAEFEKLHSTPGAPLEYLGKGLVYQSLQEFEEEIKCFALALRRFPMHPLLPILKEQILYRMHESSRYNRRATYNFILLVVRHLQESTKTNPVKKLFNSLERHWEPLSFIEEDPLASSSETLKNLFFGTQLALWLAKPYAIHEIIQDLTKMEKPSMTSIANAIFCLIELGAWQMAQNEIDTIGKMEWITDEDRKSLDLLQIARLANETNLEKAIKAFAPSKEATPNVQEERIALYLMEKAIDEGNTKAIQTISEALANYSHSSMGGLLVNAYTIWGALLEKNYQKAGELLQSYPLELLSQETTILHFLYGCWLFATEGREIASIHFFGILDTTYPRSWTLFSHYYNGKIIEHQGWFNKAFQWERRQLYRQLALFYSCSGESERSRHFNLLAQQEQVSASG